MIFKNDIVAIEGTRYRLLETNAARNTAWLINVEERFSYPKSVPWSTISGLEAEVNDDQEIHEPHLTPASIRARERAKKALWPLLEKMKDLYDETKRHTLLKQHSKETGVSLPTLYKWLRMYWQNGQCESALLPGYFRCGRLESSVTAGRGARREDGIASYQVTKEDIEKFEHALQTHYLKDERVHLTQTYDYLLRAHYCFTDGNGMQFLRESGKRPSLRQLQHYLKTHYSIETRLRSRKGDKDFERSHRPILGTVREDCLGVGDIYECDASIGDVFLVALDDVQSIIGKGTLYLVVDRYSHLIVGVYVGLENASWVCAKQALLFISQDKRAICERYGLDYDPEDWPAHRVFPSKVLADLGEWNTKGGEQFGSRLTTKVLFVPSKRADWKPVVESDFKQIRTTLQDGTPGMDPPENAMRRQGKHYEKDACMNLHEFTREVLALVIKHNRSPVADYEYSSADIREGFVPTPIAIWNKDVANRSGVLTRYSEEHVRQQLLPSGKASVTEHGIEFKGCLYTCNQAVARGWFVQARIKRFAIEAMYDHRLVDNIFVLDPSGTGKLLMCELSPRTEVHRGRSFAEVELYDKARKKLMSNVEQARLQATADFHHTMKPTFEESKKLLASQPVKKTRSARKADTKHARAQELSSERQITGQLKEKQVSETPASTAVVFDFTTAKASKMTSPDAHQQSTEGTQRPPTVGLSMADRIRLAHERMKVKE